MANEKRKRQIAVGGLIEDNPLTSGATTLTSAGLSVVTGGVGSTEHFAVVLDPDGLDGAPEIAYVTALTAAATSGTIARGQEGTTARAHARDIPWIHAPTLRDFVQHKKTVIRGTGDKTTTSTTFVDIDSTNLGFLTVNCEIGDTIELELVASAGAAGGGWGAIDWLVDQPVSADVNVRSTSYGVARYMQQAQGDSDTTTHVFKATFTPTERGTHGFKPRFASYNAISTFRLRNTTGGGSSDFPITHLVKNLGPESA